MPSRIIHDIIGGILRTSDFRDVRYQVEEQPISFGRMFEREFNSPIVHEHKILRRHIRCRELEDLPVNIYEDLMMFLEQWYTSNIPVTFGPYKEVRLVHVEKMPNVVTFGYDFRLEFHVHGDMPMTHLQAGSAPNYAFTSPEAYKSPKKKKVEKHFDEDLFEV